MMAEGPTIEDDIVELNVLILMVVRGDARQDIEGSTKRWMISRRLAQRIARLGPKGISALARSPQPLLQLIESPAMHQFLSQIEVGMDETSVQESHLAMLNSGRRPTPSTD